MIELWTLGAISALTKAGAKGLKNTNRISFRTDSSRKSVCEGRANPICCTASGLIIDALRWLLGTIPGKHHFLGSNRLDILGTRHVSPCSPVYGILCPWRIPYSSVLQP